MAFTITSIVLFFILGIIWKRSDGLNLFLKIAFLGLGVWGVISTGVVTLNL